MEKEKFVDLKLNEKKPPVVLKTIGMRDGEMDVRQLSEEDYRQLEFRMLTDTWQFNREIHNSLVIQTLILMEIAKKLGITDIHERVDEKIGNDEKEA
jgi:hypothetical protein